ncbi:MAG: ATPase, partial [Nostoc sp.]
ELQKQKQINQLQQVRFEALVRRMTEQIRDSLDQTQVLQTVTQELAELLNLDRCQIELYSSCQTLVTITYGYSRKLPHCQGFTREIADHLEIYQPLLQ